LKTVRRTGTQERREGEITSSTRIVQLMVRKGVEKKLRRKRFIYLMEMEMNTRKNLKEGMMKLNKKTAIFQQRA
jgi:hypothetical protein